MGCDVTAGMETGCRDSAGGVIEFYIGNYPQGVTKPEDFVTLDPTDGHITAIDDTKFTPYIYKPTKQSSSYDENIQSSIENGTFGLEQVATMVFSKNSQERRNIIMNLGGATLFIIVKDKNRKYWALGLNDGMVLESGKGGSGVKLNDLSGWNLVFKGFEGEAAVEVAEAAIDLLFNPAP